MSSKDFTLIDEVYHNMYKNKFHREEPLVNDCDVCDQDESSTPLQKKERAKYLKSKSQEDAEEELGPDPKDLAQYDEYEKARKQISYDNYPFWDAYHAVKEGAWSEDDFHQWCQTVWNAGAEESQRR